MRLDSEDSCDGFSTGRKVSEKQKVRVFKEELSTFLYLGIEANVASSPGEGVSAWALVSASTEVSRWGLKCILKH